MAKGTRGNRLDAWLDPVVSAILNPDRLPYDKVPLADFAGYWNGMIERSERLLGHFPPDRLLQIRFEDMQAEPEAQIRRLARFIGPTFEDEAWLRETGGAAAANHASGRAEGSSGSSTRPSRSGTTPLSRPPPDRGEAYERHSRRWVSLVAHPGGGVPRAGGIDFAGMPHGVSVDGE